MHVWSDLLSPQSFLFCPAFECRAASSGFAVILHLFKELPAPGLPGADVTLTLLVLIGVVGLLLSFQLALSLEADAKVRKVFLYPS